MEHYRLNERDKRMLILRHKHIFIVEDQPKNFAVIKTLLELHGAIVKFDRYGDQMIERLVSFQPIDLILLDLMFPNGISGYDLFDAIRATADFATVPIVAVSASDPAIAIPRTQAKGFNGFIAKPISYESFPKQIASILNDEEVWISD